MSLITEETEVIDQMIWDLIAREGGYVDDPDDDGGPTKFGITEKTLGIARNIAATRHDVRQLTQRGAFEIYKKMYFEDVGLERIEDVGVQTVVFDAVVLHGRVRAIRLLQKVVGETMDGALGPMTASAINGCAFSQTVVNRFSVERLKLVAGFVVAKPKKLKFLKGWVRRITGFID
jgi:lysozyme family protein